jgi:hypothetical protein
MAKRKTTQHSASKARMSTSVTPTMRARYDSVIEGVTKIGHLLILAKTDGQHQYSWRCKCLGQDGKCGNITCIRRSILLKKTGGKKSWRCMADIRASSKKKRRLLDDHPASVVSPEIYHLCFSQPWSAGK